MLNVLGIEESAFQGVSNLEKTAYRAASISFLVTVGLSIVANGYFGFSLYGSWMATLTFGIFMGFVQFSILRISLITLLTKPLALAHQIPTAVPVGNVSTQSTKVSKFKLLFLQTKKIRVASVIRVLFVGIIALCISFPLSSLLMYTRSQEIQLEYKLSLSKEYENKLTHEELVRDIQEANFPFHIYNELWKEKKFQMLVGIVLFVVFLPLFLVARIRYNKSFEYIEKSRIEMLKLVAIDYDETIEQCQYALNKDFPSNKTVLKELSVYADAPINSIYKEERKYSKGDKTAFNQFIQSI